MKNKNRRKLQRQINRDVKNLNKSIEEDNLWLGRFYAHQKEGIYFKYGDCGFLDVVLEFVDKKTHYTKDKYIHYISEHDFYESELYEAMDNFIIRDCKVWEEDPQPSLKNAVDYRQKKGKVKC